MGLALKDYFKNRYTRAKADVPLIIILHYRPLVHIMTQHRGEENYMKNRQQLSLMAQYAILHTMGRNIEYSDSDITYRYQFTNY